MLKWFFDFSTGFRFSKFSAQWECSVHICSCPCFSLHFKWKWFVMSVGLCVLWLQNISPPYFSTLDFSYPDISTSDFSSSDSFQPRTFQPLTFQNSGLKSLELKATRVRTFQPRTFQPQSVETFMVKDFMNKRLGLKNLGLKLGVKSPRLKCAANLEKFLPLLELRSQLENCHCRHQKTLGMVWYCLPKLVW